MRIIFYLEPYKKLIGHAEEKLHVSFLFPKMKSQGKDVMVRISESINGELKKPLKLLSLLLLLKNQ